MFKISDTHMDYFTVMLANLVNMGHLYACLMICFYNYYCMIILIICLLLGFLIIVVNLPIYFLSNLITFLFKII